MVVRSHFFGYTKTYSLIIYEDRKRAKAMTQAFDQRHATTGTADIIEQLRRSNDWITDGEKKQRPIVMVDNPNEFD